MCRQIDSGFKNEKIARQALKVIFIVVMWEIFSWCMAMGFNYRPVALCNSSKPLPSN
jgi:hypothetical protein